VAEGSVLLIVFIILSVVAISITSVFRTTLFMNNVALEKKRYEQQFRLTECLLEFGIASARILFERWKNKVTSSATCTISQWPPYDKRCSTMFPEKYSGVITIEKNDQHMNVSAQLLQKKLSILALQCTLTLIKDETENISNGSVNGLTVTNWSFCEC